MSNFRKYIFFFFAFISCYVNSQDTSKNEDLLIDMTIKKYSSHICFRTFFSYSIAMIDDNHNNRYWLVSYLPSKTNFYFGPKEPCKLTNDDLIYNKVRLIGNHPIFWSTPNDTSKQSMVIEILERYECFNSLRLPYINDEAIVVYYIIRKEDMKIVKIARTRKFWKIYKYLEELN